MNLSLKSSFVLKDLKILHGTINLDGFLKDLRNGLNSISSKILY